MLAASAVPAFAAVSYPYDLPPRLNATLKVDTGRKTAFNNRLLGLNTNFPEDQYGSDGYNDPDGQALVTSWNPPALRFPHGVWANFYDWEVDGRRIYDGYDDIYLGAVTNHPHLRYGFPGFTTLHSALRFDVLFTWNVNYDSPAKGVARYRDRVARGFDVRYVELGNEHFWLNQCSEAVDTPAEYVAVARAHAAALKAEDPAIQLSVPVSWRDAGYHVSYNNALRADMSYYDAVSLHKYLRSDGNTATDVKEALKSRVYMIETGEYIRSLFPGKPIWLSEWSVKVDAGGGNAVSVLGMTDVYLGILNRPDLFEAANYFQVHNHDPMILYDRAATPRHTRTSFGAAYDVIRDVFENSEVYASTVNSSSIEQALDAVSAEAVLNAGAVIVFAVNKSTNHVPLDLKFDDALYTGTFTHEALRFGDVNDFPTFQLGEDALTAVAPADGGILLPPLSLSRISGLTPGGASIASGEVLIEAESAEGQPAFPPYTVETEVDGPAYIIPSAGTPSVNDTAVDAPDGIAAYPFHLSEAGAVRVEARVRFVDAGADSFWHRVDGGAWVKQDGFSGGGWRWFTLRESTGLSAGAHTLEIARRDRACIDRFRLSSTGATVYLDTVARAGGRQSVPDTDADGIEQIALDGSGSTPGTGRSITSYRWTRGSRQVAAGMTANVTLPLGTHILTLEVTDSSGETRSDTARITVEPAVSSPGTPRLVAGWDAWTSGTAPVASVLAPGVTATAVTTTEGLDWNVTDERGASADGDWGTFAGPPAASTVTNADFENIELSNATTGGTITFSVTNGGTNDLVLDRFHFDAYAFRPRAARTYALSVAAGSGISPGIIYTSGAQEIPQVSGAWNNFAHADIDHPLTGLADHTLGAGESADFLLAFSGGAGDDSGGHDLWVDNVAISHRPGGDPYPDDDGNGLPDWWEILYLGSTGQVAGVDADGDGLSNGDELIAGTDPGAGSSTFVVGVSRDAPGARHRLTWDSYSGRTYRVFRSTDLADPAWVPVSGALPGSGGGMTFLDPAAPPPSTTFYRVEVSRP